MYKFFNSLITAAAHSHDSNNKHFSRPSATALAILKYIASQFLKFIKKLKDWWKSEIPRYPNCFVKDCLWWAHVIASNLQGAKKTNENKISCNYNVFA